jgi:diguanylate cyclase (GGDEF)-like protein
MLKTNVEINIVDSLGKITSYRDKSLLEQSLTRTVYEIFPNTGQRLFAVKRNDEVIDVTLLASIGHDEFESSHQKVDDSFLSLLNTLFDKVITTHDIQEYHDTDTGIFYSIYPVFDDNNNVIALLLSSENTETFDAALKDSKQALFQGILRVYSNYLNLLNNTQRDKLTGLFNRETLDERILHVLQRNTSSLNNSEAPTMSADENRRTIADKKTYLGVIDIDNFKTINDSYGHLYGDEILVLVSRCMTQNFARVNDLVYRYGGEEFVVLINANDIQDAYKAFERLRKKIESYDFPQVGNVTVSIGFELIQHQHSPQEVIAAADSALYYVKSNGKNATSNYQELITDKKIAPTQPLQSEDAILF